MRPSEDTRERTVARLRRGYVAGRLDTETFSRRVEGALQASCGTELRGLTADLPAPPARRVRGCASCCAGRVPAAPGCRRRSS